MTVFDLWGFHFVVNSAGSGDARPLMMTMIDPTARLLEQHRDAILRVCRRVLRHPQDAEDACQEVLMEVHRQAGSVQDPAAFPGWLYRTALHTALDFRRKRGRERAREARAAAGAAARRPSDDLSESVYEGLARLDDDSRALVVEHYLGGRSMRDLAAERGCSRISIWKRLRNVRKRLQSTVGSAAVEALVESRWQFFGPGALPVGMAALVGVACLISLPTSPVSPTSPVVEQDRPPAPPKPYPYKASTLEASSGAQWAWSVLSTKKVTLDEQNVSTTQLLESVTKQTGLKFIVDPDLAGQSVSFKVQSIVVDGCLRLLLQPRRMDYEIRPDGQIHVGMKDRVEGGFERAAREAEAPVQELKIIALHLDAGWSGVGDPNDWSPKIAVALKRTLTLPQGESSLSRELARLEKTADVRVSLDLPTPNTVEELKARQAILNAPFVQPVEERTLGEHLAQLAARLGLVVSPTTDSSFEFTTPEKAGAKQVRAEERFAVARKTQQALDKALPDGGRFSVQRFAGWVTSTAGIRVIPSEDAWNAAAEFSIAPGATLRQGLDGVKSLGYRWAFSDGKLYILK